MKWHEVKERFPNEWVVLVATKTHSKDGYQHIEEVIVIDRFQSSIQAMHRYDELHREQPYKELCFFTPPDPNLLHVKDMREFEDLDENTHEARSTFCTNKSRI